MTPTLEAGRPIVPVYFDYASTLCYVAWRIVSALETELGFTALWKGVPIRLRNQHSRPGNALGAIEREKILTVIAETGITVAPPAHWIDSDLALQGAELAREARVFAAYHAGVFRAAFEEQRDIARPEELSAIAAAAGMEPLRFGADLAAGKMAVRLEQHREEADRFSALGYPTFILGEFPLTGIQPIATMRLLLRRYLEQRSREGN
ncbi:MAG: DsbA family oxidoreductase [Candidatus Binataceae bacterium]